MTFLHVMTRVCSMEKNTRSSRKKTTTTIKFRIFISKYPTIAKICQLLAYLHSILSPDRAMVQLLVSTGFFIKLVVICEIVLM